MDALLILAVLLVCPLVMGTMMFFMMRGKRDGHRHGGPPDGDSQ